MTYQNESDLSRDPDFNARAAAAVTSEARPRIDTGLGRLVMNSPVHGAAVFMPFLSSAPTFGEKYAGGGQTSITDGDLLSAVQASWDDVAAVQGLEDPAGA